MFGISIQTGSRICCRGHGCNSVGMTTRHITENILNVSVFSLDSITSIYLRFISLTFTAGHPQVSPQRPVLSCLHPADSCEPQEVVDSPCGRHTHATSFGTQWALPIASLTSQFFELCRFPCFFCEPLHSRFDFEGNLEHNPLHSSLGDLEPFDKTHLSEHVSLPYVITTHTG